MCDTGTLSGRCQRGRIFWLGRCDFLCVGRESGFLWRGWIVLSQEVEVEAVGCAYWLQPLIGASAGLGGAFANDSGLEETARVLEIAHEFHRTIAGTVDAEVKRDVAILGANGF